MNRLLLSCVACLVLFGTISFRQFSAVRGDSDHTTSGVPRQVSSKSESFRGNHQNHRHNDAAADNDQVLRPHAGLSMRDNNQATGVTANRPYTDTPRKDPQYPDFGNNRFDDANGGPTTSETSNADQSGSLDGATTSQTSNKDQGGRLGDPVQIGGKGEDKRIIGSAPKIKLLLGRFSEGYYLPSSTIHKPIIKLVLEGVGVTGIQEITFRWLQDDYWTHPRWKVESCKRGGGNETNEDLGALLFEDNGGSTQKYVDTKKWVECGVEGELMRHLKTEEEHKKELRRKFSSLQNFRKDSRGEGWIEEDQGGHNAQRVEVKQTGDGRWVMQVVTGAGRWGLLPRNPWSTGFDDYDEDEVGKPVHRGADTTGQSSGRGGGRPIISESAPNIKLLLETVSIYNQHGKQPALKLRMEGGKIGQIQEIDFSWEWKKGEWLVQGCKGGGNGTTEEMWTPQSVKFYHNPVLTKRWIDCGADGRLKRNMQTWKVKEHIWDLLNSLQISGGRISGGWTEKDGGEHAAKKVDVKQNGGGRWFMEVVTSKFRIRRLGSDPTS